MNKMIILANDGLEKEGIAVFEREGIQVDTQKRKPEELIEIISQYDGLLVRSATKATREVIVAGKDRLKIIGRAGVGYDNVDVQAAKEFGIVVKYAPHGNTLSTAEMAFALMMSVSRNIPQAHNVLKNGSWEKKPFNGYEMSGKTLGIIGCGRIGQALADFAKGFDMKILGYDLFKSDNPKIQFVTLVELAKNSDYISMHVSGKNTVITKDEITLMKPTAIIVNAARGGVVDEEALYEALIAKKIAGYGVDCFKNEPKIEKSEFVYKLAALDNVVMTPHLGASTKEAQRKTGIEIAEVVSGYLTGKDIWRNAVNVTESAQQEEGKTYNLFITHKDEPGMFGKMNTLIGQYGINIRDTPSRVLDGSAQTVYILKQEPTPQLIKSLRAVNGVKYVRN